MTEHVNDKPPPNVLPASSNDDNKLHWALLIDHAPIDRPVVFPASNSFSPVAALADIPEEEIWLAKQKSKRTRRAYKLDVRHFMRTLHITTYEELRRADHRAVIAWERIMREIDEAEPSTIRRRLAALSSLFKHLVRHGHAEANPVSEVERPAINRREGSTLAFSKADAARLLNTPAEDTIEGLRDRAILSVGLQVGLRREEIAALSVEDLHQNPGFDSLRMVRKGGRRDALAVHPNVAQRIRAHLDAAGHANDLDGPMFRPLGQNRKGQEGRRHMDPDIVDRILRKHAATIGLTRGYSAHSMRATFITTALEDGATLDDVQRAAGHAEPGTTKLYDQRGYNPEVGELLCDLLTLRFETDVRSRCELAIPYLIGNCDTIMRNWIGFVQSRVHRGHRFPLSL